MTWKQLHSILVAALSCGSFAFVEVSHANEQNAAQRTPEEIVKMTHDSYRKVHNPNEIAGVEMWCRDTLSMFSFKEREQLSVRALSLIDENKIEEANKVLKRVIELEELDKNLADLSCKINSMDEAVMRSNTIQKK